MNKNSKTSGNATTTAAIVILNDIPQGDTDITRDGDSVKLMSSRFTFTLEHNTSGAATQYTRLILFKYKEPRTANPPVSDILKDSTNPISLKMSDRKRRFVFLRDEIHKTSSTGNTVIVRKWWNKLNIKTQFNQSAAVPETNGLYLLFIGSEATHGHLVQYENRLTYIDN